MPRKRDHNRRLLGFAKRMRHEATDAERRLWSILRRDNLAGYHFRRQVPVAGYILDFCCISACLAVEADGGQHSDEKTKDYDRRRAEIIGAKGIRILRFSDYEILKTPEAVAQSIYRELTE